MGRQFVTAGEGILKVFWSQIISAVTVFLNTLTVGLTVFAVFLNAEPLIYLAAILVVAGQVLALLGLSEAAIAHSGYRSARLAVILTLVSGVGLRFVNNAIILNLLQLVSLAGSIMLVYYICKSNADLLMEKGEETLAERGAVVWKAYLTFLAASFLCELLSGLFYASLVGVVLAGVYLALQIGCTILFLVYLFQSQRALRH